VEQPRLPNAGLADDRDDLTTSAAREFERMVHPGEFAPAADELGNPLPLLMRQWVEIGQRSGDSRALASILPDRITASG
jgi:hypothetical protein